MKTSLRLAALFVTLLALALWFFGGPNLGKTQTRVPVRTLDAASQEEHVLWENRFLPGLDFLGASLALSATLIAASFFTSKK